MVAAASADDFTQRMLVGAMNSMMIDMLAAISRKDYDDRRRSAAQGIAKVRSSKGNIEVGPENVGDETRASQLSSVVGPAGLRSRSRWACHAPPSPRSRAECNGSRVDHRGWFSGHAPRTPPPRRCFIGEIGRRAGVEMAAIAIPVKLPDHRPTCGLLASALGQFFGVWTPSTPPTPSYPRWALQRRHAPSKWR